MKSKPKNKFKISSFLIEICAYLQGADVNYPDKQSGEMLNIVGLLFDRHSYSYLIQIHIFFLQKVTQLRFLWFANLVCIVIAGQTALHRAIHHGHFDIALLLLGYGASFEMNDFKLKSPVQYCCKAKNYVHEQSQIKEQSVLNSHSRVARVTSKWIPLILITILDKTAIDKLTEAQVNCELCQKPLAIDALNICPIINIQTSTLKWLVTQPRFADCCTAIRYFTIKWK